MRFGISLRPPWDEDATTAEQLGFDVGWCDDDDGAVAPLVVAGGIAPATRGMLIAAAVDAGAHPVALAEEAAVADLSSGGRLILCVASDDQALLTETVDVLFACFADRPFAHVGDRWTVPAQRPEHTRAEARVLVSPSPAQIELPVWLAGAAAPEVSATHGLTPVCAATVRATVAETSWTALQARLGPAAGRLRRPALRDIETDDQGNFDASALTERLRDEQRAWGLDLVVVCLPPALAPEPRRRAMRLLATYVRPRLQLDRVPDGLEAHWAARAPGHEPPNGPFPLLRPTGAT